MRPFISFAKIATVSCALLVCSTALALNNCEQLARFGTPQVEITATALVQSGIFYTSKGKSL